MPDVKVMHNVLKNILHVAGNGDVPVWDECGDQKAISDEVLHALFEGHELHRRTTSSFIPLQRIKLRKKKR